MNAFLKSIPSDASIQRVNENVEGKKIVVPYRGSQVPLIGMQQDLQSNQSYAR